VARLELIISYSRANRVQRRVFLYNREARFIHQHVRESVFISQYTLVPAGFNFVSEAEGPLDCRLFTLVSRLLAANWRAATLYPNRCTQIESQIGVENFDFSKRSTCRKSSLASSERELRHCG
jgi:hypothetical protein